MRQNRRSVRSFTRHPVLLNTSSQPETPHQWTTRTAMIVRLRLNPPRRSTTRQNKGRRARMGTAFRRTTLMRNRRSIKSSICHLLLPAPSHQTKGQRQYSTCITTMLRLRLNPPQRLTTGESEPLRLPLPLPRGKGSLSLRNCSSPKGRNRIEVEVPRERYLGRRRLGLRCRKQRETPPLLFSPGPSTSAAMLLRPTRQLCRSRNSPVVFYSKKYKPETLRHATFSTKARHGSLYPRRTRSKSGARMAMQQARRIVKHILLRTLHLRMASCIHKPNPRYETVPTRQSCRNAHPCPRQPEAHRRVPKRRHFLRGLNPAGTGLPYLISHRRNNKKRKATEIRSLHFAPAATKPPSRRRKRP